METLKLTKELYQCPIKERNLEKNSEESNRCICCGKPINENNSLLVHMNTDWLAVNPQIVNEENCEKLTGAESQGSFYIGNECAKKMIGFTF